MCRLCLFIGNFSFMHEFARFLIAERFSHQIYLDSSGVTASSCDYDLIAEAFWRETIMTRARSRTGNISVKPDRIRRGSHVAHSGNAALHICNDFIHAYYKDDMAWTLN